MPTSAPTPSGRSVSSAILLTITRLNAIVAPIERSNVPVVSGTRKAKASSTTITSWVSTNSMLPFQIRKLLSVIPKKMKNAARR